MLEPLVMVVIPVALGASLALAPARGSRLVGPIRTFSLTASVAVVLFHLLPDAYERVGIWALLVFAAGFGLPAVANLLAERPRVPTATADGDSPHCPGLEVGYIGLCLHRVGEGMALAAVGQSELPALARRVVYVAIVAHAIPVVAAVSLAYLAARGRWAAWVRSAGIALAGVAGVLIAGSVPLRAVERVDGWVAAAVAGLLLHVVAHDARELMPGRSEARGVTLAAALAGVSLGAITAFFH